MGKVEVEVSVRDKVGGEVGGLLLLLPPAAAFCDKTRRGVNPTQQLHILNLNLFLPFFAVNEVADSLAALDS